MQNMQNVQRSRREVQHPAAARDFLSAQEVGRLLNVDRSTVYRMAEGGGLTAVKVGRQWRFPASAIERFLRVDASDGATSQHDRATMVRAVASSMPLIELSAQLLGVMMIATDMDGQPVTDLVNPCSWFSEHADDPGFVATCLGYWKQLADDPDLDVRFHLGPLNVECARTFVRVGSQLVGMLFVGGIDPTGQDERPLYRLNTDGRTRVLTYLPAVAAAISRLAAQPLTSAETGRTI